MASSANNAKAFETLRAAIVHTATLESVIKVMQSEEDMPSQQTKLLTFINFAYPTDNEKEPFETIMAELEPDCSSEENADVRAVWDVEAIIK